MGALGLGVHHTNIAPRTVPPWRDSGRALHRMVFRAGRRSAQFHSWGTPLIALKKKSMRHILIIAYSYPPLMEAQSIRWAHLSRELIKKGDEVDVLTIRLPEYYKDGLDLVRKASVHRTYPGPLQALFFRTKARLRVEDKPFQEKRKSFTHQVLRRTYDGVRRLMNLVLIPDLRTEWLFFALPELRRLMRKKRYDLVISSHEPGVDHLLGLVAKVFYQVCWMGDFSDPMVTFYTPRLRRPVDRRVQGALLKRMDSILVTNQRLKEEFLAEYSFLSPDRIRVLTQGFDDESWKGQQRPRTDRGRLCLVYTGTFYRGVRDPGELFEALRSLSEEIDVELVIAGRNDGFVEDARRLGLLGKRVTFVGYLRYEDSIRIQQGADVLVHLGNLSANQVPGKVYEYLGAGKPILAIFRDPGDEGKELVLKLQRGVVAFDESSKIREAIVSLWDLFQRGRLQSTFRLSLEEVSRYSWGSLSNLLTAAG